MIELTTGLPGTGKTLYTITTIKERAEKEGRPVYYNGIPELNLPWIPLEDPTKWHECPPNSIVVLDEAQKTFRPRGTGSAVPEHVAKLETHRHQGIDLIILTQQPMLLDSNVRRLVGRHQHLVRPFGLNRCAVHEWAEVKENCGSSRTGSIERQFSYPKEVFKLYKSAEVHTHRRRIPWFVYVGVLLPFVAAGLIWKAWHGWQEVSQVEAGVITPGQVPGALKAPAVGAIGQGDTYLSSRVPRVATMPWTAPRYDEVMKVAAAPLPKICLLSATRCVCYTEQSTKVAVSEEMCKAIAQDGYFDETVPRETSIRRTGGSATPPLLSAEQAVRSKS
jgi:zona occludens toxin